MIWHLLEKQHFAQKACLTISSKLLVAPAGDLGRVEQTEDLARPSEQGSEPGGGHA